jgi:cell wall-associated NlpC family hydrolase
MTSLTTSSHINATSQGTRKPSLGRGFTRRAFLGGLLATAALATVATIPLGASPTYTMTQLSDPARTVVTDANGAWVATFTNGSRTVILAGPSRTFAEASATNPVVSTTWVRLLAAPFAGSVDTTWLDAALADSSPDMLAIAMQYIAGAPSLYNASGLRIAGDAHYGALQADGTRKEGSDFNDYLGVAWTYPSSTDQPEADELGSLDCSGFTRMVWGYRGGIPLTVNPNGVALPRRATQQHTSSPGILVIDSTVQITDFTRLQPGDLVFFDADAGDGTQSDHVGTYLGPDTGGHHRFISSRKSANGPTLGDTNGKSILNGTGLYARSFRAARRL